MMCESDERLIINYYNYSLVGGGSHMHFDGSWACATNDGVHTNTQSPHTYL